MDRICQKVLYTASSIGHLHSFHHPYLQAFMDRGCRVTTAAAGRGDGLPAGLEHVDIRFTKSFVSPKNLWAAVRLARLIRREDFDLILTHTSLAAFFTRLAVRLAGKKDRRVVNVVHGYLFDDESSFLRRHIMLWAEKLMAGVTDEILTMNSQDTLIAQNNRLCRGSVSQIPGMGLDPQRFTPATDTEKWTARAMLGLPEKAFVLIYAAEFSTRKNQAMLLQALTELPEDTWLVLPGRGEFLDECKAKAKELYVESRVLFPGFVTNLQPWLQAADLGVSSSRSEGLPFNVMEAMSAGLPCVVTHVKGHEDLIFDGINGYLFPFNDKNVFLRHVRRLREDPETCRILGEAARSSVMDYSLDKAMSAILAHFF